MRRVPNIIVKHTQGTSTFKLRNSVVVDGFDQPNTLLVGSKLTTEFDGAIKVADGLMKVNVQPDIVTMGDTTDISDDSMFILNRADNSIDIGRGDTTVRINGIEYIPGSGGNVHVNNLKVNETLTVMGATTLSGTTTILDTVEVGNTLTVIGATTLSTLNTQSDVTIGGNLSVVGATTLMSGLNALNNVTVGGMLSVQGDLSFANLYTQGNATIEGTMSANTFQFTNFQTTGNATIGGTLTAGNFSISNLTASGNATVSGVTRLGNNLVLTTTKADATSGSFKKLYFSDPTDTQHNHIYAQVQTSNVPGDRSARLVFIQKDVVTNVESIILEVSSPT